MPAEAGIQDLIEPLPYPRNAGISAVPWSPGVPGACI